MEQISAPAQFAAQEHLLYGNSKEVLNHDAAFFGIEGKLCSEVGVSNGDELAGAGAERFTSKVGNAVLCDDIVNIIFAGSYNCTGLEDRFDAAYSAVFGGRGECDKALAALGKGSAAYIVNLAAGTGHVLGSDAFSADLTPNIALQRGVDGNHIVILADDCRVVYIVYGKEGDTGVIVYIVIKLSGAVGEGGDSLTTVNLLLAVVGSTAFQKVYHRIGKHLGVDAKVVLVFKGSPYCVGNSTYAQLDAGAIINHLGDKSAYGFADRVYLGRSENREGTTCLYKFVHLADVNLGAAYSTGNLVIYFKENTLGFFQHCAAVRTYGTQ